MAQRPAYVSDNQVGAGFALLFCLAQILNDALMKQVVSEVPIFQSLLIRGILLVPLIAALLYWRGELMLKPKGRDQLLIGLRILCEMGLSYCLLNALLLLPIANVIIVTQAVPFGLALCAAWLYGEQVGWRRWLAILAGFLGVLLVIKPGTDGFDANILYAVVAVALFIIKDLLTRQMSPDIPATYATLPVIIGVTIMAAMLTGFEPWVVLKTHHYGLIFAAGLAITLTNIFGIYMMRVGDVSFVQQFRYSSILFAILFGYVFFDEVPDGFAISGAMVITAAGLYSLHREHIRR